MIEKYELNIQNEILFSSVCKVICRQGTYTVRETKADTYQVIWNDKIAIIEEFVSINTIE